MDSEWVLTSEDTPALSQKYSYLTANVYVKLSDGTEGIGYFNYRDYLWYSAESKRYQEGEVVAWKSM